MARMIYGVAINDADYIVKPTISGKRYCCPFYKSWFSMIVRCYSSKYKSRHQTYANCSVCDEWLVFSNFKKWMEYQDWQGKQLDKDILFNGNKLYSPSTCCLIDDAVNKFITDSAASRGDYPIGVDWSIKAGKFRARCGNPKNGSTEHLGYFACPNEANSAWKKRKQELACQLAEMQDDPRVAEALRLRYA